MNAVSSRHFIIEPWKQSMTTFVSDLGLGFCFGQAYPDSCDEGMSVISVRTGQEVKWVVTYTHHNDDGLAYWKLEPVKGSPASVRGWVLYIYND